MVGNSQCQAFNRTVMHGAEYGLIHSRCSYTGRNLVAGKLICNTHYNWMVRNMREDAVSKLTTGELNAANPTI